MLNPDSIEGIDILRKKIPDELQYWHKFGNISELHYERIFDNEYGDYICCIEIILTDNYCSFSIKLSLFNVSGELSFNMTNGFYSGLTIDDCSDWGYEKNCRFRISSLEHDIEFEIYCERIKAELL